MRMSGLTVLALAFTSVASSSAADVRETYKSLFAHLEPAPQQRQQSAAFAAKLLGYAEQVKEDASLKLLLLEKTYEFGMRDPAGYPTVMSAMKLMASVDPLRDDLARKRVLEVLRRQYSNAKIKNDIGLQLLRALVESADLWFEREVWSQATALYQEAMAVAVAISFPDREEIQAKLQQTARVGAKTIRLHEQLKRATKQDELRKLVLIYLFDLDDVHEAAKWVERVDDDELRRRVALANKLFFQLTERESLELARWYEERAREPASTVYSQRVRLSGVIRNYRTYLALHPAKDLDRVRAEKAIESAQAELKAIRDTAREPGSR